MAKNKFQCSHCNRSLVADEKLQGMTVICPSCKDKVIVPANNHVDVAANFRLTPKSRSAQPSGSEPLLTLKPVLVMWIAVAQGMAVGIIWGIVLPAFFLLSHLSRGTMPVVMGAIALFVMISFVVLRKVAYSRTSYRFYGDHIEYSAGLLSLTAQTVRYERITEAAMNCGVIQKSYGLGTICLATAESDARGSLLLKNVRNPEQVMKVIQQLTGKLDETPTEAPVLAVKPVFVWWLWALPVAVAIVLIVIGNILLAGHYEAIAAQVKLAPAMQFGIANLFSILLLWATCFPFYTKLRTYEQTEYKFYQHHLEYYEGFWTIQHKSLRYDKVAEAGMRRTAMQRMLGLGSIYLMPAGAGIRFDHLPVGQSTPTQQQRFGGICLADIRDVEDVYQKVQQLLRR